MEKYTRDKVIDQLVERDLDQFGFDTIANVIREGCIGYENMPDREILEYFLTYIRLPNDEEEAFLYEGCVGEKYVVEPVDEAGIKIDGVVDDYQYI